MPVTRDPDSGRLPRAFLLSKAAVPATCSICDAEEKEGGVDEAVLVGASIVANSPPPAEVATVVSPSTPPHGGVSSLRHPSMFEVLASPDGDSEEDLFGFTGSGFDEPVAINRMLPAASAPPASGDVGGHAASSAGPNRATNKRWRSRRA